jgi:ribosomal protein S18 acetylase RimI-like enzyme
MISPITIAPYARQHRRELLRLIQNEQRLHIHLDWHTVGEWISDPDVPIYLAWHGQEMVGAIAASPPQENTSWLRLIVSGDDIDVDDSLAALWPLLQTRLIELGVDEVGVLVLHPWLAPHLSPLGFTFHEEIVTLRRQGASVPPPRRTDVYVHHVDWREAKLAAAVDHAAFAPIWQLDLATIRQAARAAYSFTLAELGDRVIGYQISTLYHDGAHLARLATLPEVQGSGVGGVLLGEMIEKLLRHNISDITVNTQQSNIRSQRLYQRYGFEFTGLNMPVWTLKLLPTR